MVPLMKEGSPGSVFVRGCTVEMRECLACGECFEPCRTVKEQKYCSKPECQRERKRRWQRAKLADDPEYRENHRNSQKQWRERNPDYWRKYRKKHQDYVLLWFDFFSYRDEVAFYRSLSC